MSHRTIVRLLGNLSPMSEKVGGPTRVAITRKDFLKSAGAAALGLMLPDSAQPAPVDIGALPELIAANLPTADDLWEWLTQLAGWCPPFTGSPGHTAYVDFLDEQLHKARAITQRKSFKFPYWELKEYGLKLGAEKIHATGYRPYAASTPPTGVTAPMFYAGMAPKLDFLGASGKIALIDVPLGSSHLGKTAEVLGSYPLDEKDLISPDEKSPVWAFTQAPDLKGAQDAGAVGAIYIWNGISDANAEDQAQPFNAVPSGIPALWVGNAVGQRLKSMAASSAKLTLTLHAVSHPDTTADNLWGILPGKTEEMIIVNSHTDGCNACEENGGLGVIALAKYFSKMRKTDRNRTLVFLLTSGHFGHGYVRGTEGWMKENPDFLKLAVACVTIEHLGAIRWEDNPSTGGYKSTGRCEWGVAYTPLPAEGALFLKAVEGTAAKQTFAARPTGEYPGEGAPFWRAGVPTISYISAPQYLMTAPAKGGQLDKLDKNRLYGEVSAFARCVAALDKMPVSVIKGTEKTV